MKAVTFGCSSCKKPVLVEYATMVNGDVTLIGDCVNCGIRYSFSTEKIKADLLHKEPAQQPERVVYQVH